MMPTLNDLVWPTYRLTPCLRYLGFVPWEWRATPFGVLGISNRSTIAKELFSGEDGWD